MPGGLHSLWGHLFITHEQWFHAKICPFIPLVCAPSLSYSSEIPRRKLTLPCTLRRNVVTRQHEPVPSPTMAGLGLPASNFVGIKLRSDRHATFSFLVPRTLPTPAHTCVCECECTHTHSHTHLCMNTLTQTPTAV